MTLDEALLLVMDDLARQITERVRGSRPALLSEPMNALDGLAATYPEQFAKWQARGKRDADDI